jgi:hypothetical protein
LISLLVGAARAAAGWAAFSLRPRQPRLLEEAPPTVERVAAPPSTVKIPSEPEAKPAAETKPETKPAAKPEVKPADAKPKTASLQDRRTRRRRQRQ